MLEPNYTTKFFTKCLLAIETSKTQILMNEPVYLGLSILDLSKAIMYEFLYDCVKPKYCENAKFCYMDTVSFIAHIKTDNFYKDIAEGVETRFDASSYELDRRFLKGKNKKVIGLIIDELGKIMEEFVGLRAKTYNYVLDNGREAKKSRRHKKVS